VPNRQTYCSVLQPQILVGHSRSLWGIGAERASMRAPISLPTFSRKEE
jgi:hypothetical protein